MLNVETKMESCRICLDDFEKLAKSHLPFHWYEYYVSGANDEETLKDCRAAFKRYRLRPRILRDVSCCHMTTTVLSQPISFPVGISPTGLQKQAHHEGEIGTAKAADKAATLMILSCYSNTSIEDVTKATPNGLRWMQCHIFKVQGITEKIVRRAERSGFKALVVTVDSPCLGGRVRWVRVRPYVSQRYDIRFPNTESDDPEETARIKKIEAGFKGSIFNDSETWEDIKWLKGFTRLPVIVKGVLTAQAALEALQCGVDGIIVSAHGGRQLDTVFAPIDALSEVVAAVKGSGVEVYMDGGVRTGTDVFKALALGARAVFLGRLVIWGLACDGENGVSQILNRIREEFSTTMKLMGCSTLEDIKPSMVIHESQYLMSSKL